MAGGDRQHRARPIKLGDKHAAEDEPAHDADEEAVQLPLQPDPHELLVSDGSPKHNCKDWAHEGGDEHACDKHYAGVLNETWGDVLTLREIR